MNFEEYLYILFDYHRFENNGHLLELIDSVDDFVLLDDSVLAFASGGKKEDDRS